MKNPASASRTRLKYNSKGVVIGASVDLGYCQISTRTLEDMGFLSTLETGAYRDSRMIFTVEGSKAIALEVLAQRAVKYPKAGVACLYVKWRWGPYASCTKARLTHGDALEVSEEYKRTQQTAMR